MASAPRLPRLLVFDLDACLWHPEMYELAAAPTKYNSSLQGVAAGDDTVRLYPGAAAVLRRLLVDPTFSTVKVAVASSTTEPAHAARCLEQLPIDPKEREERMADLVDFRQIYPGNKGRQHIPALAKESGVPFDEMVFWDDCTYSDNCADVAAGCPGTVCVRTPEGMTEALFDAGLAAFARGASGVYTTSKD
jgi:magnesium-dependent phosphatase 1